MAAGTFLVLAILVIVEWLYVVNTWLLKRWHRTLARVALIGGATPPAQTISVQYFVG